MGQEFTLDYEPREAFIPFHQRSTRWAAMCCHRRAGKTVACVHDIVMRAIYNKKKNAQYGYVGPFRKQAKDVAWKYLKDATNNLRSRDPMESELRVRLYNGAEITIYGADNPNAIRGMYFDGLIVDEYADMRPSLWGEILLPTLVDRKGWCVFIGTIKGKNHFYKTLQRAEIEPSWFYMKLKGSESGILDEEDLIELRAEMNEAQYQQEIECNPDAAIMGTYYSEIIGKLEKRGQIGDFPYDPSKAVNVACDLGFSDSTAFWFWQMDENGPILVDYYEADSQPLDHYFQMLDSKGYEYGDVWLPHDAAARTLQTGRSTIEQFKDRGYPIKPVPRLAVQHGIDGARKMLPDCRFNLRTCTNGIEALRAYRRQFNEKTQQFSNQPLHDWASNGSDAFRYFALVTDEKEYNPTEKMKEPLWTPPQITLNDLWTDREQNDDWRSRIIRI